MCSGVVEAASAAGAEDVGCTAARGGSSVGATTDGCGALCCNGTAVDGVGDSASGGAGAARGGVISGTGSTLDGGCVELVGVRASDIPSRTYRSHSQPYSSYVDGGAAPRAAMSGASHEPTNFGASAPARRRQKSSCASGSGSAPLGCVWWRKTSIQNGSVAKYRVQRSR
jgi:hypothetical protein